MNLIDNPHFNLKTPVNTYISLIRGNLKYFHYLCDGFDDKGWGCGYRTLQTILSWVEEQKHHSSALSCPSVPSILEIQKALVDMGDKGQQFIDSREWIGSVEVAYCIDYFHKVQCKIIHTRNISDLKGHVDDIVNHFAVYGSPIMMGGDKDCSSKCILGISINCEKVSLLILDPHYSGTTALREELQSQGWIKWQLIDSLDHSSFYNLCCPLFKAKD